jgi:hypothetical protein
MAQASYVDPNRKYIILTVDAKMEVTLKKLELASHGAGGAGFFLNQRLARARSAKALSEGYDYSGIKMVRQTEGG